LKHSIPYWQNIPHDGESLMVQDFPQIDNTLIDEVSENSVNILIELVKTLRNIRAELNVAPKKEIDVIINTEEDLNLIIEKVKFLSKIEKLEFNVELSEENRKSYAQGHITGIDIFVNTAGLIDVEKEKAKINKELEATIKELSKVQGKLNNEGFIAKAPEAVVEKQKKIEAELLEKKSNLEERLSVL